MRNKKAYIYYLIRNMKKILYWKSACGDNKLSSSTLVLTELNSDIWMGMQSIAEMCLE